MMQRDGLLLTEPLASDSETLFQWINDPDTVHLSAAFRPVDEASHSAWFESLGKRDDRVTFVMRTEPRGAPIGMVWLFDIHPVHRAAELGIRIGSADSRGRGFGTTALRLALEFAWRDLNLNRVWLRVFSSNERAIRAYEKAGFEKEGVLRESAWINGAFVDQVVMAALRGPAAAA